MITSVRALALCAAVFAVSGPSVADGIDTTYSTSTGASGLAPMLGTLMDIETTSLASVPPGHLERLATPFIPPRERALGHDPRVMSINGLAALGPSRGNRQWRCLTEALYFEARGEVVQGQYAVAEVILNRVDHPNYPASICEVVNEGTGRRDACQFSYTCDGRPETITDRAAWHRLGHISRIMMDGAPRDLTGNATHYHATWVNPRWARVYPRTAQYGVHIFYRQQY